MTKDKVEAGEWTPEQGITAVTLYAPIAIAGSVMFAKKLHIPSIESLRPANNMNIEASSFAKVYQGQGKLTVRQEKLLEALPRGGKEIKISKAEITMNDLAFLTAKTGDEFTMFTLGSKRMILRGNKEGVRIEKPLALKIKKEKWTWSGHTHPGSTDFVLNASGADREVLEALKQRRSMIANSSGTRNVFDRKNDHHLTSEAAKKAYRETD